MTNNQALAELQQMYPDCKELAVEYNGTIGAKQAQRFYLWDKETGKAKILASSDQSWEHALALAKVGRDFPAPETEVAGVSI